MTSENGAVTNASGEKKKLPFCFQIQGVCV